MSKVSISKDELQKLYADGLSHIKIAKLYGVSEKYIGRLMKECGIKARIKYKKPETIILSDKIVSDIWSLYNHGTNRADIAKKLNITEWAVTKTITGRCRTSGESRALRYKNNTIPLSYDQEQVILGSLLGDAALCHKDTDREKDQYYFEVGHCLKQKDYLVYTAGVLGSNVTSSIQSSEDSFSTGKEYFHTYYYNKYELKKIYAICNRDGIKTVSKEWLNRLDPFGVAIWFMDDGSSYANKNGSVEVRFATNSFGKDEQELLRDKLLSFGIETTLHKTHGGTGLNIAVRQKSVNKFMDLVEPYIVDCMRYKVKRKLTLTRKGKVA